MPYARIAVYRFPPGVTGKQVAEITERTSLPVYRQQPGFIRYEGILAEDNLAISISTWESREHADAAVQRIAAYLAEDNEAAKLVQSYEHRWVGDVIFSFGPEP